MTTSDPQRDDALAACVAAWTAAGFVPERQLERLARLMAPEPPEAALARLMAAFNGADLAAAAIARAAAAGDAAAAELAGHPGLVGLNHPPVYERIDAGEFARLRRILAEHPDALRHGHELAGYPHHVPGRTYRYDLAWVRAELARSGELLEQLRRERKRDVAVLVGNGPSLNKSDLSLLHGQDVFISNYAIKHPLLSQVCTGVAVTNHLVAEQEPFRFMLPQQTWKFFPFWLRNTFVPDARTVMLNAEGGELFYGNDASKRVAWHSTVSYFWLQILHHLGYERVLMIGFDNSYQQSKALKEGDLIRQTADDPNHFDPNYFKGKTWQAADTDKMAQTYALAAREYAADGREIVNCTVGGKLELFRRGDLAEELAAAGTRRVPVRLPRPAPRIALVTPFWKGDAAGAERHWRLVNRVGHPGVDHLHLFKHGADELPPVTFPKLLLGDIESRYPEAAKLPHPAGPNLCFVETVRLMREQGYSHFFWFEPDCIPTRAGWLQPFLDALEAHPDAPVIGAGGGSVTAGVKHWKHHFAGCSLYSVEHLSRLDWNRFVTRELDISFDIWLTLNLGYIELTEKDELNTNESIIVGAHRYHWNLLRRPEAVVTGMFEHWRPEKFLSPAQLRSFLSSDGFSLYHAIKDEALVREVFAEVRPAVSTVIINYNNAAYLAEAIESALAQESGGAAAHQVVVVDDGSDDGSLEIIAAYGEAITPVLLSHGELNGNFNQQRALKAALPFVRGEIVLLLDGDDCFLPGKLAAIVPAFDDPDVVLVQHALERIDEEGQPTGETACNFRGPSVHADQFWEENRTNFFQPTSGLAFRRVYLETAANLLGFDAFHRTWLDVRLTRFAPLFGQVVNLHEALGSWRRHAASDSIIRENLRIRLAEHHRWYNDLARTQGLAVDYAASAQDLLQAGDDPFAPLLAGERLHATPGPEPEIRAGRGAGAPSCAGFARGRLCTVLEADAAGDPAALAAVEAFDLAIGLDDLPRLEAALRASPSGPARYGYLFILFPEGTAAAIAAERLAKLADLTGRQVHVVVIQPAAGDAVRQRYAVLTALGYAGFAVLGTRHRDDAELAGALPAVDPLLRGMPAAAVWPGMVVPAAAAGARPSAAAA